MFVCVSGGGGGAGVGFFGARGFLTGALERKYCRVPLKWGGGGGGGV